MLFHQLLRGNTFLKCKKSTTEIERFTARFWFRFWFAFSQLEKKCGTRPCHSWLHPISFASQVALHAHLFIPIGIRRLLPFRALTYMCDYLWSRSRQWFVFYSVLTEYPASTTVALLLGRPYHVSLLLLLSPCLSSHWLFPPPPSSPRGDAEVFRALDEEKSLHPGQCLQTSNPDLGDFRERTDVSLNDILRHQKNALPFSILFQSLSECF